MSSGFICVVACVRISLIFKVEKQFIVSICHILFLPFIHKLILGFFYFIAPVKTVAMNIIVLVRQF